MAKRLVPRMTIRCVEVELAWVPVPQHWRRRMFRGFNQSEVLAEALSAETGHRKSLRLLKRIRHTPTQTARTYTERVKNVKDAFRMNGRLPFPESVLLIDDVITTGATVDECARTLKESGVKWVGALSFALAQK
jgi:ComF family protein